jgi:hypothetical protein
MPNNLARWCVLAGACLTCACGGGGLGQSRVESARGDDGTSLDAPLAVGATYRPEVKLQLKGGGTPALFLESPRADVVAVDAQRLKAVGPGLSAVLIKTREGNVIDFLHVWVEAPTRIALHRFTPETIDLGEVTAPIDLAVGESVTLSPRLYAGSQRLAGSAEPTWLAKPPLVDVLRDGVPERRRIVARRPGKTTLMVRVLGQSSAVELNVVGPTPVAEGAP